MNQKLLFVGIIIAFVFITGCLNDSDNALDNTVKYNSSIKTVDFQKDFAKVPYGGNISYLGTDENITYSPYSQEGLESSDLIFYGTIKEFCPSVWTTLAGQKPDLIYFTDHSGMHRAGAGGEKIYTDVRFTVDEWVKGNGSKEITVRFFSGQIDDVVYANASWPSPWDVEINGQYLLYVVNQTDYHELCAINGMEIVVNKKTQI